MQLYKVHQSCNIVITQVIVADLASGFAYAGQEAWIQHSTVRDNILFGLPYNESYYSQVIYACALEQVPEV